MVVGAAAVLSAVVEEDEASVTSLSQRRTGSASAQEYEAVALAAALNAAKRVAEVGDEAPKAKKAKGRPKPRGRALPFGRVPQNAKFPGKLRSILETVEYQDAIHWNDELRGIVLVNPDRIAKDILPAYFYSQTDSKTDIFKSFRRQLIYYGFEDVNYKHGAALSLPSGVSVCTNKDPTIKSTADLDRVLRYVPPRKHRGRRNAHQPPPAEEKEPTTSDNEDDNSEATSSSASVPHVSVDGSGGVSPVLLGRPPDTVRTCRRSHCLTKYCDCFQLGYACDSVSCHCIECDNLKTTRHEVGAGARHRTRCHVLHRDTDQPRSILVSPSTGTLDDTPRCLFSLEASHCSLVARLAKAELDATNATRDRDRLADENAKLRRDNTRLRGLAGLQVPLCALCHDQDAAQTARPCGHVLPVCLSCADAFGAECAVCLLLDFSNRVSKTTQVKEGRLHAWI